MQRVLVICTSFPPINATAIHRTLALVRQLRAQQVQVLVLTMAPPPELPVDALLMEKIPPGTQVIRIPNLDLVDVAKRVLRLGLAAPRSLPNSQGTGSVGESGESEPSHEPKVPAAQSLQGGLLEWLGRWLQFPDNRVGWMIRCLRRARRAVREFEPDVIYSTAPMWSAHVLAVMMKRKLGRPWVADCRDPWCANPYRHMKHHAHERADHALEAIMVRNASAVICNTPAVQRDFCARYSQFAGKFRSISNGFDAAELAALGEASEKPNGTCRLVHTGVFYGPRSPVPLFRAMAAVVAQQPRLRPHLRLVQVGEVNYERLMLADIARQNGVEDMLELTGPLGHRAALRQVLGGTVAIAASQSGPNSDFQVPRKFYEYYGLGKPVLAYGGACRAIREILGQASHEGLWLVDEPSTADLAAALADIVEKWQRGELASRRPPTVDLTEDRMARQLESLLRQAFDEAARPA